METAAPSKVICQCPHEDCGEYFTAHVRPGEQTTCCAACGRQQSIHPVLPIPEYHTPARMAALPPPDMVLAELMALAWLAVTPARKEYFMSDVPRSYAYKTFDGPREYHSAPYSPLVEMVRTALNLTFGSLYNVCFLNRYDNQLQHLGWHADDSPEMDHEHPIAVLSYGVEREIWWKEKAVKGVIEFGNRKKLEHGSLFVMPPGFQQTHLHRIPKADRAVGTRVSLTFRRYIERG